MDESETTEKRTYRRFNKSTRNYTWEDFKQQLEAHLMRKGGKKYLAAIDGNNAYTGDNAEDEYEDAQTKTYALIIGAVEGNAADTLKLKCKELHHKTGVHAWTALKKEFDRSTKQERASDEMRFMNMNQESKETPKDYLDRLLKAQKLIVDCTFIVV